MKPQTPAPAQPSAAEAAALVAQLRADIAATKSQIETAESNRNAKALTLTDPEFEAHVLATERAKRSLLRLKVQLQAAEAQLAEAKAREKEARRAALYGAGLGVEKEVERLTEEYAERAAAVVETLRKIGEHAETIRVANDNVEHYTERLDVDGLRIGDVVVLPHQSSEGGYIWCKGEPAPPPPKYPSYVLFDGIFTIFDETNPGHVAARAAEKTKPAITPRAHQPAPQNAHKFGEQTREDGTRVIKLPPIEWQPRHEAN